jgi:hypothetical protein
VSLDQDWLAVPDVAGADVAAEAAASAADLPQDGPEPADAPCGCPEAVEAAHGDRAVSDADVVAALEAVFTRLGAVEVAVTNLAAAAERLAGFGDQLAPVVTQLAGGGLGGVLGAVLGRGRGT